MIRNPSNTAFLLLAALILAAPAYSQETQKLNLDEFPGEIVEKVVIPVPAEVFAVLNKLGEPNWSGQIRIPEDKGAPNSDRIDLAFEFGSLVAEGFITVQAEDVAKIKEIGARALKLAGALGLGDAVQPHSQSIIEAAEKQNWEKVRSELDLTQTTVRETLEKLRDDDLGNLISLGGWVRGTHALTSLINDNYNRDKAELLNQPDLVSHFVSVIDGMGDAVKEHKDVAGVREGLVGINAQLTASEKEIPADAVAAIGQICEALLGRFYFSEAGGKETGDGGNVED